MEENCSKGTMAHTKTSPYGMCFGWWYRSCWNHHHWRQKR